MAIADEHLDPRNLLYTKRGKVWIDQFSASDREIAERLVSCLTLVSHSEFERSLQKILESQIFAQADSSAFYAVREIDKAASYFSQQSDPETGAINALAAGSDHGSEARVATLIRNLCKTDPHRLLNHPSISEMRMAKCRTIYLVDDFIGSGERMSEFIRSLRRDKSFDSWCSLKYVRIVCVAYSGTSLGIGRVERAKRIDEVIIERPCPTFRSMPWSRKQLTVIADLCEKYGRKTSLGWYWEGYGHAMAALVFEHGCPDNVPPILWAPDHAENPWSPLFPDRVVLAAEKSVFPPEIARRDSTLTLLDVGQKKIAMAGSLARRGAWGQSILLVLALIAKGQRRQAALSFATGLSQEDCLKIIDKCEKWGFLTRSRRITDRGHAELGAARKIRKIASDIPSRGSEDYYPKMLRRATRG